MWGRTHTEDKRRQSSEESTGCALNVRIETRMSVTLLIFQLFDVVHIIGPGFVLELVEDFTKRSQGKKCYSKRGNFCGAANYGPPKHFAVIRQLSHSCGNILKII